MVETPILNFVSAVGHDFDEMRENFRKTELYQKGDARLIWVNEGDLHVLEWLKKAAREALG